MLEAVKGYYNSEIKYKSRLHTRWVKEQMLGLASLAFVTLGAYQICHLPEEVNYSFNAYRAAKKESEHSKVKPQEVVHPALWPDLVFGGVLFGIGGLLQVTKHESKKDIAYTYREKFMENWLETTDWGTTHHLRLYHRISNENRACSAHHKELIAEMLPHMVAKNDYPISEN